MTARIVESLRIDHLCDEFGKGHLVLGLASVELDDMRQELDVAKSEIDGRRTNPERQRIAPEPGEKTVEITFRRHRLPAPQRNGQ